MIFIFLCTALTLRSQELFFNGNVATWFDNTEYAGSDCGSSRTIFAVEFDPSLGWRIDKNNTIVIGAQLLKDFGSDKFINSADPIAYYRYDNGTYGANAGIFGRDELVGRYSRAFYSDSTLIYNSCIQGVAMRYTGQKAFAELAVDWVGMYSPSTREQFRVLAAAGGKFADCFDAGVSMSLQHFANKSTFSGNVVDNILINPYIGAKFNALLDFEVRIGYLQSMQQDRMQGNGWITPFGGELYLRMGWKGIFIDNNLYVGKSLTPFWNTSGRDGLPYAESLYTCDPFYGTTHKVYNRTGIGYERKFLNDNISVRAEMVLQCNGAKLYCQQLVSVSAKICPTIYDKTKHK